MPRVRSSESKLKNVDWSKYQEFAGNGLDDLEDRDYACLLLPHLDYDYQLRAIHDLLRRNRETAKELGDEIDSIDSFARKAIGLRNERAVDEWLDHMQQSVYQSATHSMAAVGMLAPFFESLFHQAYLKLDKHINSPKQLNGAHPRWTLDGKQLWDCHFVYDGPRWRKDIRLGIKDLAEATGLAPYLPTNLWEELKALFSYRNKMFHHGFEWPMRDRESFLKNNWASNWFGAATSEEHPWVIYMQDNFIETCVTAADDTITAIGSYAKQLDVDWESTYGT